MVWAWRPRVLGAGGVSQAVQRQSAVTASRPLPVAKSGVTKHPEGQGYERNCPYPRDHSSGQVLAQPVKQVRTDEKQG